MLAVLFGLSMDCEVFLVSRIREEWAATGDNHHAVRTGQATTGRVIIAAATIMILVFSAFILSGQQAIGEIGIGLGAAVLLDAFLLRTLLVPALMHLSGCARTDGCPAGWTESSRPCPSNPPPNRLPRPTSHPPGSPTPRQPGSQERHRDDSSRTSILTPLWLTGGSLPRCEHTAAPQRTTSEQPMTAGAATMPVPAAFPRPCSTAITPRALRRACPIKLRCPRHQPPAHVDAPGGHRIAGTHLGRDRFAGEHRRTHGRAAGVDDLSVTIFSPGRTTNSSLTASSSTGTRTCAYRARLLTRIQAM